MVRDLVLSPRVNHVATTIGVTTTCSTTPSIIEKTTKLNVVRNVAGHSVVTTKLPAKLKHISQNSLQK